MSHFSKYFSEKLSKEGIATLQLESVAYKCQMHERPPWIFDIIHSLFINGAWFWKGNTVYFNRVCQANGLEFMIQWDKQ